MAVSPTVLPRADATTGAPVPSDVLLPKYASRLMLLLLQWVDPIELHGIGQYASDAYFIFCRGLWREVSPTDKDLLKYQQWLQDTNGEGTGLERDVLPGSAEAAVCCETPME